MSNPEAATETSPKFCGAPTKAGHPCRSKFVGPSGLCASHDPSRAAEVREWRVRGGQGRSELARLEKALTASPNISTLIEVLAETTVGVRNGTVAPAVANAVSSLSKAMVGAMQVAASEDRLRRVEMLLERVAQDRSEVVVEPLVEAIENVA